MNCESQVAKFPVSPDSNGIYLFSIFPEQVIFMDSRILRDLPQQHPFDFTT